jgi:hypothetical protein
VRVRRALSAVVASALLGAVGGCGFLEDMADPETERRAEAAPRPTAAVPAVVAPDPDAPRTLVEGDLLNASGVPLGRLTVTAGPVQTGLVPPVPNFAQSCPVEGTSLQYVPVDVALTGPAGTSIDPRLAARLPVSTGPATPSDIGDVGVFVESGDGSEHYCGIIGCSTESCCQCLGAYIKSPGHYTRI